MADIIITIRDQRSFNHEIKLSDEYKVSDALRNLEKVLPIQMQDDFNLQAEPLGKILIKDKTFKEQQITHGTVLTII